jgi:hypothetical protein
MEVEVLPEYKHIFEGVPPIWRQFEYKEDKVVVHLAFGFETTMSALGMHPAEFRKFFDSSIVRGGRKILKRGKIIFEPKKTASLHIRLPDTELAVIKKAAELNKRTLTDYCLETILGRAVKELEDYSYGRKHPGAGAAP